MAKPTQALRWTLGQAAGEFAIHRDTLHKRLVALSQNPGEDEKYSTGQITAAVFGDLAGEKLGKAKADREKAEIEAAKAKGEVILASDAEMMWSDVAVRVRSEIERADFLNDDQKERLLKALQRIKLNDEKP